MTIFCLPSGDILLFCDISCKSTQCRASERVNSRCDDERPVCSFGHMQNMKMDELSHPFLLPFERRDALVACLGVRANIFESKVGGVRDFADANVSLPSGICPHSVHDSERCRPKPLGRGECASFYTWREIFSSSSFARLVRALSVFLGFWRNRRRYKPTYPPLQFWFSQN